MPKGFGVRYAWICLVLGAFAAQSAAAAPALPDQRVYEVVSPPAKNGGDVMGDPTRVRVADDGSAVTFASLSVFGDALGSGLSTDYMSVRAPGVGWQTHALTPPQEPPPFQSAFFSHWPYFQGDFSGDLTKAVFRSFSPLTDAPNSAALRNLYLRDDLRTPGPGNFQLLSQASAPATQNAQNKMYEAGASDDFRHVLFESVVNLTGETTGNATKLFEWFDGNLTLAGVLPDAEGGGAAANSQAGRKSTNFNYTGGAISSDGRRVVFTVPLSQGEKSGQIYLRVDGVTTARVNASEKTLQDSSEPATFGTITRDGSKIFFTTVEQLTDDDDNATEDLYVYDTSLPDSALHNLTRVSVDGAPSDGLGASVYGVIGASGDGSYVYFIGQGGQLAQGGPAAVGSESMIYVRHDDVTRYIGAFGSGDSLSAIKAASLSDFNTGITTARVTPDGRSVMFTALDGSQLTGYDHGNTCNAFGGLPCSEVYVYSAAASGGQGALACASCNPSGSAATSDASPLLEVGRSGTGHSSHVNNALSDDGERVFFTTGERLLPEQDANGKTLDVYEYVVSDGSLHLISSGKSSENAYFLDASPSGDDVFFITRERLVPWDTDQGYDLYDARVNGGLPDPSGGQGGACAGTRCQGPGQTAPSIGLPASGSLPGGSQAGGASPVFFVHPLGERQLRHWAKAGEVGIRVDVSRPGRLGVRARAARNGRSRVVASVLRRDVGAGTATITLRLGSGALRALKQRGSLRLVVRVRYSRAMTTQQLKVTLKQPVRRSGGTR